MLPFNLEDMDNTKRKNLSNKERFEADSKGVYREECDYHENIYEFISNS